MHITANSGRASRSRQYRSGPLLWLGCLVLAGTASAQEGGTSPADCADCGAPTTEVTAILSELTADDLAADGDMPPADDDANWLATTPRDLFAPDEFDRDGEEAIRAGFVGNREGDLDAKFQGSALIDSQGKSSVFMTAPNGGSYASTELRPLGVGIDLMQFGERFYTVSLQQYVGENARFVVSRHRPDGRLDASFGGFGNIAAGRQFYEVGLTGGSGQPLRFVPTVAVPIFQPAGGNQTQYQRFVIVGNIQLSTTRRSYGLLCLRLALSLDRFEPCPNFDFRGFDWPLDFFQNDTSIIADATWLPRTNEILLGGQVRNNPSNVQDLDFFIAKHRLNDGLRDTNFASGAGFRVVPIDGTSRDIGRTIAIDGGQNVLLGGSSFRSSQVQGAVVKLNSFGGLHPTFCLSSASVAQCGPAAVRNGKRVFELGPADTERSVRRIAVSPGTGRYTFVQDAGGSSPNQRIQLTETSFEGFVSCAAASGRPTCRSGLITGQYVADAAFYGRNDLLTLFTYTAPEGGNGSALRVGRYGDLVLNPSSTLFSLQSGFVTDGAAGFSNTIDFPTFDNSAVTTSSARLAVDRRGRAVLATRAKYNTSAESFNRVGIFRLKADVIYDHSFDY